MSIDSFMDSCFMSYARTIENSMKGKVFKYKLYNDLYGTLDKVGKCIVKSCVYDRGLDCNVYCIKDVETGETYSRNQFKIDLEEVL